MNFSSKCLQERRGSVAASMSNVIHISTILVGSVLRREMLFLTGDQYEKAGA